LRSSISLIFFLTMLSQTVFGQSDAIDSVKSLVQKSHGTLHVDALNAYGYIVLSYDYVEAKELIDEAYQLGIKLNYKKGMAESMLYKGLIAFSIGNDSSAMRLYRKGIAFAANDPHLRGRLLSSVGLLQQTNQLDSAELNYQHAYELLKDSLNPLYLSYLYLNLADLNKIKNNNSQELIYLKRSWEIRKRLKEKHPMVWAGVSLANYYTLQGNYKEAVSYLDKSYKALEQDTIGNEEISVIYKQRAIIYSSLGENLKALNLFSKAISFYERNPFPLDMINLLTEIGAVQASVANYETSLKYYFEALKLSESIHFERQSSQLNFRIARVYYFLEQNDFAEDFCQKNLSYSIIHGLEQDEAFAQNLLGLLATRTRQFTKAQKCFDRALILRQKGNYLTGIAGTLGNLGELYEVMNEFKKAEEYDLKSLAIEEQINYAMGKNYSYQSLGQLYIRTKQYQKAEYFLNKGETLSKEIGSWDVLAQVYKNKRDLWLARNDLHEALKYSLKYENLKDSLLNKNVANRILSLQHGFELDQKNNEIKILNQQRQLQQSRMEEQQAQISFQRLAIIVGIVFTIGVCIVAYIIFRYYQRVRKLNIEVAEQNEEITVQSEELKEANEVLGKLNRETSEQREEIQAQAEELAESNQTIARVNETLEEKIKTRTNELKEAYRELDTFFYRSSHDFRRPLTTFMGLAEVAKITVKDQSALELFEKVNETARNLDKMLMKLQSVSMIGNEELVSSEIFFRDIFQAEQTSFQNELLRKKIQVTIDVELSRPLISYPALIKIVVQNLLENAISFSWDQKPVISLKAMGMVGEVLMEVNDNGQGIDSNYLPRVCEMYFRANERSTGNGLGLFIVKKMVDKLEARLEIKSKIGEGTTVSIFFPYK